MLRCSILWRMFLTVILRNVNFYKCFWMFKIIALDNSCKVFDYKYNYLIFYSSESSCNNSSETFVWCSCIYCRFGKLRIMSAAISIPFIYNLCKIGCVSVTNILLSILNHYNNLWFVRHTLFLTYRLNFTFLSFSFLSKTDV